MTQNDIAPNGQDILQEQGGDGEPAALVELLTKTSRLIQTSCYEIFPVSVERTDSNSHVCN